MSNLKRDVIEFFPKEAPYPSQETVLNQIVRAFDVDKVSTVIVEAQVGFGKSAVAVCLSEYYGSAHIITPRKSLQDQYQEDFPRHVKVLKGMSNYPCFPTGYDAKLTEAKSATGIEYQEALDQVMLGKTPTFSGRSCARGPCRGDRDLLLECTDRRPCVYKKAIEVACRGKITVSNIHSFVAYSNLPDDRLGLTERELLIVDECQDTADIIRGFITKMFIVPLPLETLQKLGEIPNFESMEDWVTWFTSPNILEKIPKAEVEGYYTYIEKFSDTPIYNFVVSIKGLDSGFTEFTFIPRNIGNAAEAMLLKYGKRRLLMSGTIYDKEVFCYLNGLNPAETEFIKVAPTLPAANAPIIFHKELVCNTSHKTWEENYPKVLYSINRIMKVFGDKRGLIHAPSYEIAHRIHRDLKNPRVMVHQPDNFQERLNYFLNDSEPDTVFISPTCYQGIDLKGDRGRFQIIIRVPYPNISDVFIKDMLDRSPLMFSYLALVTFGQQTGRVMRSPTDWGKTYLIDSRFSDVISQHRKWLSNNILPRLQKV